jgi:uncharacterized repeat protein (TIGR03806 family)
LSLVFLAATSRAAEPYGLKERQPVGAFLDGRLPESVLVQTGKWAVVDAFTNLTVDDPTMLIPEPGSDRLYVSSRQGQIFSFINRPDASDMVEFLNLTNVTQGWDDCGLLAFAFHPDFNRAGAAKRFVYVWYHYSPAPVVGPERPSSFTSGYDRLSRFTVPAGSLVADRNSEQVLINQFDHNLWHEGSGMAFGPDGFLYLSVSDEGASYDYYNNTQTIHGKMFSGVLRIDVDQNPARSHPIRRQPLPATDLPPGWTQNSYTANYFIPNDNPFLDPAGGELEEFYAVGLRNPHRMTLDPVTGRFWIGDVGQDTWEEVDVLDRAANYQWGYMEGFHSVPNKAKPAPKDFIGVERPPVYEYEHGLTGNCVIGGYVYRGKQFASEFGGKYIFGDNGSGRLWAMTWNGKDAPTVDYLCNMPPGFNYTGLSSFGIDAQNEIYMLKMGRPSKIYKLTTAGAGGQPISISYKLPPRLSDLHAFTDLAHLVPAAGIVPYGVNSPFWSDGASKKRWIATPGNERIAFSSTGNFSFPAGTVFIKNFELTVNETSGATRRLETRFIVRDSKGGVYGITYKWRPDGSDADLVSAPVTENIQVTTARGERTQTWYYPGPLDCLTCHNQNSGGVLGVNARQLNGPFTYATGVTDNQLRTWNHIGLINAQDEVSLTNTPRLVAVEDTHYSLEYRVRSYLDANCAYCHQPNGPPAYFDARFSTPLAAQRLIDGPLANSLNDADMRVVSPGDLSKSVLYARINRVGALQMPPLARNLVNTNAVNTVGEWIKSLPRPSPSTQKAAKIDPLASARAGK